MAMGQGAEGRQGTGVGLVGLIGLAVEAETALATPPIQKTVHFPRKATGARRI